MDLVKGELEWPVTKCENCDYDLKERPKASEKANDEYRRLIWNDFCPQCGTGYKVGDRLVPAKPAEVLAQEEIDKVVPRETPKENLEDIDPEHQVTPGKAATNKASGIPPDKRARQTLSPGEGETAEPEFIDEEAPVPGEPRSPGEGEYWCTKCACSHREAPNKKGNVSKVGQKHLKYRE